MKTSVVPFLWQICSDLMAGGSFQGGEFGELLGETTDWSGCLCFEKMNTENQPQKDEISLRMIRYNACD